jgi:hypothetical protein
MDILNYSNQLKSVDQDYEIIGTQKYLDKFTKINNCKLDDERKKYELAVKINEDRVKRSEEHPCMCIKDWRYEASLPLYYKGKIQDIDWKPNKFYCDDNTLVEDLKKLPNRVKIINNGIDNYNQDKLKELNRKYGFDYNVKNNVMKCSTQKFLDTASVTELKWGNSRSSTYLDMKAGNNSNEDSRNYWHALSEKDYLKKGPYRLCTASFNNAPFSLGNYSTDVRCKEDDNIKPSNSLWHNMTKRKSLY